MPYQPPQGDPIKYPIIKYKKSPKLHILNAMNVARIRAMLGTEVIKNWIGSKIKIYPAQGNWFGNGEQAALRVRVPDSTPLQPRYRKAHLVGRDLTGTKAELASDE